MLQWLTNVPIFRRLFFAFFLAALIPDIIIIVVSGSYRQVLNASHVDPAQTNPLLLGTIIALLISTGIVTLLGFLINRTITQRLLHLAALTKQISRGETDKRAKVTGHDEIYMVAVSMNMMLDNIVQFIQKAQGQRDFLQAQAEKLAHEVTGVSEDMSHSQRDRGTDALGTVANSFNYMIAQLNNFIADVKRNAGELEISATKIFEQVTQLVEDTEAQVQQSETTTGEAVQISLSSQQVVERVQLLKNAVTDTHQSAHVGRDVALQSIESIERMQGHMRITIGRIQQLGRRSHEMDDIMNAITNIIHQTNRLALDISLQSAVAGEDGKKLTVVANDMRRVAEQTKEQTAMINSIVQGIREDISTIAISLKDTQRETMTGTTLVQSTSQSLEKIFALMEHHVREIEVIHSVVRNLLTSSGHVAQVMQDMSQSTRQRNSTTRVVVQNMEYLVGLVKQLPAFAEAFKIKSHEPRHF